MPDQRTELTEIMTGIGMLGGFSVMGSLSSRPAEFSNLDQPTWDSVVAAATDPISVEVANASFANGAAFLASETGLRGRRPIRIEWKGPHRNPGADLVPVDLRVDHVYLISCKYQSNVLLNPSPNRLFVELLQDGVRARSTNWYEEVAKDEYHQLYRAVRTSLGDPFLPDHPSMLTTEQRRFIKVSMERSWPADIEPLYQEFSSVVSRVTADRWRSAIANPRAEEMLLWRMLRIGSAPYFLLGTSGRSHLRLRVGTAWDFRQDFELKSFDISAEDRGQPCVRWAATLLDKRSFEHVSVTGHVEIRWSHGKFGGSPEAKVYLDTPHSEVPGYYPI